MRRRDRYRSILWLLLAAGACSPFTETSSPPADASSSGDGGVDATSSTSTSDAGVNDGSLDAAPFDDALVLRFRFDEGTGTIAQDSVGNRNATLVNAGWKVGKKGNALALDGVSSYATAPGSPPVNLTELTFAAWLNLASTSNDQHLFTRSYTWFVKLNGRRPHLTVYGGTYVMSSESIAPDAWHHLAITYATGRVVIYIDGVQTGIFDQTLDASAAFSDNPNETFFIGTDPELSSNAFAKGAIDEVQLYKRALSANEIMLLAGQ